MRQLAMTYSIALDTVPINHVSRNYHVEVCLISSLFCLFALLQHFDRKMSSQKKRAGLIARQPDVSFLPETH